MRTSSSMMIGAVAVCGVLAGVAIAGTPSAVDKRTITAASTTLAPSTTAAPTTVAQQSTTSAEPSTTAAPAEPFDRATLRLVVANASNLGGIATSTASRLVAAGFTATRSGDALVSLRNTVVYARAGFEAAAAAVAEELGLDPGIVQPLPTTSVTEMDKTSDVVVAIGNDFPV